MATIQEFGQAIKQKYPQYQNEDDTSLGNAMLEKYPQYRSQITNPTTITNTKEPSFGMKMLNTLGGILPGAVKGVLDLPREFASLGTDIGKRLSNTTIGKVSGAGLRTVIPQNIQNAAGDVGKIIDKSVEPTSFTTPQGTGESIGYGLEKVGELFIPGGASVKAGKMAEDSKLVGKISELIQNPKVVELMGKAVDLPKVANIVGKTANLATRSMAEAAIVGTQTAQQEGKFDNRAKTNAIIAAALPWVGAALSAAKKPLANIGKKIQLNKITATASDVSNGFKFDNMVKHDLLGDATEIIPKTQSKLNELNNKLTDVLTKAGEEGKTINLADILTGAQQKATQGAGKTFGKNIALTSAFEKIGKEIEALPADVIKSPGVVDLLQANVLKRASGTMGAWQDGMIDKEAQASAQAYDYFYLTLKDAIENSTTNGTVKNLNKQMSEIIPILSAAIRKAPVEQRRAVLGLVDNMHMLGAIFDPRVLGAYVANKTFSSAKFAQLLINAGKNVEATTNIGKRIFGK